ncbi:hypothetical protein KKF34_06520 [Myxococcota bacterium]|nr:hypothetical protein [Myxococcota bacterium]MBU1381670.1 hypothetical protein [Myxococcota bacterium]MBU1496513.1 hypothetical protein [Myxococcota bacterium]
MRSIILSGMFLFLFSCSGGEKKSQTPPQKNSSVVKTQETEKQPPKVTNNEKKTVIKTTVKIAPKGKINKPIKPAKKLSKEEEELETVVMSLSTEDATDFIKLVESSAPGFAKLMKKQKLVTYPLGKIRAIAIGLEPYRGALVELTCIKKNQLPKECSEEAESPPESCEKFQKFSSCGKKFKPQYLAIYLKKIKGNAKPVVVAESIITSAFSGDKSEKPVAVPTKLFESHGIFSIDITIMDETDASKTPTGETKSEKKIEVFSVTENGFFRHINIDGDRSYSWQGIRTERSVKSSFVTSAKTKKHYLVIEEISKQFVINTGGVEEDPRAFCSRKTEVYIIEKSSKFWKKVKGKALKILRQKETELNLAVDDDLTEKGKGDECPSIK